MYLPEAHWGSGELGQWFGGSTRLLVEGSVVEVGLQGGLYTAYGLHDRWEPVDLHLDDDSDEPVQSCCLEHSEEADQKGDPDVAYRRHNCWQENNAVWDRRRSSGESVYPPESHLDDDEPVWRCDLEHHESRAAVEVFQQGDQGMAYRLHVPAYEPVQRYLSDHFGD